MSEQQRLKLITGIVFTGVNNTLARQKENCERVVQSRFDENLSVELHLAVQVRYTGSAGVLVEVRDFSVLDERDPWPTREQVGAVIQTLYNQNPGSSFQVFPGTEMV